MSLKQVPTRGPGIEIENSYWDQGFTWIAGVDEAGRGPLAGPVIAAACILPRGLFFEGVNDSKQLSSQARDELYLRITSHPDVRFSFGVVEAREIDQLNILQATMKAMHIAVQGLSPPPEVTLVDGNRTPNWPYRSQAVIKGDQRSHSIAAASVLAKVERDRRMQKEDEKYPVYGLRKHKGYGTSAHIAAIIQFGPCPLHRLTFEPLKSLFAK